jgi:hypothetical protein
MTENHTVRESWLQSAIDLLRDRFQEIGLPIPAKIRVAVGFGPNGARQESKTITGVTLNKRCSDDQVIEIWISPESASTFAMLGTLIHELIHAALNAQAYPGWWRHDEAFAQAGKALGLVGPMASSTPGPALAPVLAHIIASLGAYPGARVTLSLTGPAEPARASTGPRKQTGSRYLLAKCTEDDQLDCWGYQVRITQRWADIGLPDCPEGHRMKLQD